MEASAVAEPGESLSNEVAADPFAAMPLTPDELLSALAAHEQRGALLAVAVRAFETSGEWAQDGSSSMAAWLRHHGRMSDHGARRWVRHGRFLDRFPMFADAAATGRLSADQMGALRAVRRRHRDPVMREHQPLLVHELEGTDVELSERICAEWAARADAIVDAPEPVEPERSLHVNHHRDGTSMGQFNFDEALTREFDQAIGTAISWHGPGETRTISQRRADALWDIVTHFNQHHERPARSHRSMRVALSVDAQTLPHPLAVDGRGRLVDPIVAATLLCDCTLNKILRDPAGVPIGFGRSTRTVPGALFQLLAARDGCCRYPGCNRPTHVTHAHHIRHWADHGTTDPENLVLLCSRHHHLIHRLGIVLKLLPDGELHLTWSCGRHLTTLPRGRPPTG